MRILALVDGSILMQDRVIKAFDEEEVLAKARETALRLVGR